MKLYERVKLLREDKKISQEAIAHELGLSQSQYCRRESGSILFVPHEIRQLAKLLEVPIPKLFDEETNSFTVNTQNGGNFGQYINLSEKVIELYEAQLKEKDATIAFLRTKLGGGK